MRAAIARGRLMVRYLQAIIQNMIFHEFVLRNEILQYIVEQRFFNYRHITCLQLYY